LKGVYRPPMLTACVTPGQLSFVPLIRPDRVIISVVCSISFTTQLLTETRPGLLLLTLLPTYCLIQALGSPCSNSSFLSLGEDVSLPQ
jgi:hypothetical protein